MSTTIDTTNESTTIDAGAHADTTAATTGTPGPADRVLIGLSHGSGEPENVLIAYLMGVEALRAGKEATMWLTKDGIDVALDGFADTIDVPGAPSVADLHEEFVSSGGRLFACPVCVKLRNKQDATWTKNVEIVGAPSVYEFTAPGALVFNY
jgi:predicted peroxiredoxin